MRFSTSELAAQLGGKLVGPDVTFDGAGIDSRTIRPGQLYVPIVAERDGHDFIGAALEAGAAAYLTMREPHGGTAVSFPTPPPRSWTSASWRARRVGGVVGITGSVGQDHDQGPALRLSRRRRFRAAASERSFNNELGLPLTLLNAPDDVALGRARDGRPRSGPHRAPRPGGAARRRHRDQRGHGTRGVLRRPRRRGSGEERARGVAAGDRASPSSTVDDPRVAAMASVSPCPVLGYGVDDDADVRREDVVLDDDLRPRFRLVTPWGTGEVRLALHGLQQVPNALAAAAAALWCGVPFDAVVQALSEVTGSPLRMEVRQPAERPRPDRRLLQRQPGLDRGGAALAGGAAGPGRKLALLGPDGRAGRRHRGGAPADGRAGRRSSGSRSSATRPGSTGRPRWPASTTPWRCCRPSGPGDAVLVKGSRVARLEEVVTAYGARAGAQSPTTGA